VTKKRKRFLIFTTDNKVTTPLCLTSRSY